MLTDLGSFLQVASGVLVITSLAGVGLMRARVTNLADRVNDLRGEVADKDRQHAELAGVAGSRTRRSREAGPRH
jgi:hypothetical protein